MVQGFKKEGVFHPITKYKGVSRHSRVRYSNDSGSTLELNQKVKDFARKIQQRRDEHKREREQEFEQFQSFRRRFEGKLVDSYQRALKQQITDPRKLEQFIRREIPDLPNDKKTNEFVVETLRDFKQKLNALESSKKGKPEEVQKALQDQFDLSVKHSTAIYKSIQLEEDKKAKKYQEEEVEKYRREVEKLEKEFKQKEEAEKAKQKAKDEAKKTEQDPNASQEQKQKAKQNAEEAEKKADKESKDAEDFADKVADELKKDTEEVSDKDFNFGFPQEIVAGI